jgi:hypothetical protein
VLPIAKEELGSPDFWWLSDKEEPLPSFELVQYVLLPRIERMPLAPSLRQSYPVPKAAGLTVSDDSSLVCGV